MFEPDRPIESSGFDHLGRTPFAQSLGEAIMSYQQRESVVVALYGPWGSGKTSLMNIALKHITGYTATWDEDKQPIIMRFNPWMFSSQDKLISQFFKQLSSALEMVDKAEIAQNIGEKIERYADFFEPLKLFPITEVQAAGRVLPKALKLLGKNAKTWGEQKSSNLDAIKKELEKALAGLERKIIVVIDDIDRLTKLEIKQIFQLVKSIADFPNLIYWLAFDKEVVQAALEDVQGNGSDYLEKIIQVPIEIPMANPSEIENLLFSKLNDVLGDLPEERFDNAYWGNLYLCCIRYFFKNIRDINRYINAVGFNYNLIKEEVNIPDLLAITAIQVFYPEVYSEIQKHKAVFSGVSRGYTGAREIEKQEAKEICDRILAKIEHIPQKSSQELLRRLFPKLEGIYNNTHYDYGWLSSWRRERRICSPDCFDIYFRLSIISGELSQREFELVLSMASDENQFIECLNLLNESRKILGFLDRFEDYTDIIPETSIQTIIAVLMHLGDLFPDDNSGWFGIGSAPMRILRIVHQLIIRIEDQDKRFHLLKTAILNTSNSINTIVNEVSRLDSEQGRFRSGESEPEGKWTVNKEQLDELEQIACSKIKEWAKDGKLESDTHLVSILYRWREWGDILEIKQYIETVIKTDDGLLNLVTKFLTKVNSTTLGDYVSRSTWKIDLKNISDFMELVDVEKRIRNIQSSGDVSRLSEKNQNAVRVFLNAFDGKSPSY